MGKASLAFALTIVAATICLVVLTHPSGAQVGDASLVQYGNSVGQYADTARRGFESSRDRDPGAVAEGSGRSSSSVGDSESAAAGAESSSAAEVPQDVASDSEVAGVASGQDAEEASEDGAADAEASAGTTPGEPSNALKRLPDTGGPGTASLFWGVIAILMLGPGTRVVRVVTDR